MKDIPTTNHPIENKRTPWVLACLLFLLTFIVYLPEFNNDFVNWDDPFWIINNSHIRHLNFTSIGWMFTHFFQGSWTPLTLFSLSLDYQIGGLNPQIYHLHNILLHCLNTILVFLLSLRILFIFQSNSGQNDENLTIGNLTTAFLTALLFGIHPIHVEPVALATERNDLLCTFFYFMCLLVYVNPSVQRKWKNPICLVLFILALLSKPMAITLPLVLLILDYWPQGRFRSQPAGVWVEKIPFFAAAFLTTGMAVLSRSSVGTLSSLNEVALSFRLMNAFHSLIFYLKKMLAPTGLTTLYPLWLRMTYSLDYVFSLLAVILIFSIIWIYRKKFPYLTAAWLYYLVTLAPVLGILQVGSQAAADRYAYLPSLAPLLLFAAAATALLFRWKFLMTSVFIGISVLLSYLTAGQIGTWKSAIVLWENVLKFYPRNSEIAYSNLAEAYQQAGRLNDALEFYTLAISKGPPLTTTHDGRGKVLLDMGRTEESIQELKFSISLDPNNESPRLHLAEGYEQKGMHEAALLEIQEAIRINPDFARAYHQLGIIYRNQLNYGKALVAFRKAISLEPQESIFSRDLMDACQLMKKSNNRSLTRS